MIAGPTERSRLVKVVAMSPEFPFYGSFQLKPKGEISDFQIFFFTKNKLLGFTLNFEANWILDLLEILSHWESIQFTVANVVVEDSGLQFQPAEFAPKIYISQNFLDKTELLQQGNTAFRNQLFRLPDGVNTQALAEKIGQELSAPDIKIYSHQRAGHRAGRLLRYLSDFLALVSLVALFLACLGSGYLFHGFLIRKIKDIAILVSLGASPRLALFLPTFYKFQFWGYLPSFLPF